MISLGAATGAEAVPEVPAVEAVSIVVPPEADAKIKGITNETRLAILKEKLATMKGKVADDAMNKPNGGTVSSVTFVH